MSCKRCGLPQGLSRAALLCRLLSKVTSRMIRLSLSLWREFVECG